MPVLTYGPEKRYATALFELAIQEKNVSAVAEAARQMSEVFVQLPQLAQYLQSKIVAPSEKAAAVVDVAKTLKTPAIFEKFLRFTGQENRLDVLPGILFHLNQMVDTHAGKVTAQVATAQALSDAQRKALIQQVTKLVPEAKSVELAETVNAELIGGLRLQIGSQEWDNTLRHRLTELKTHLTN